MVQFKHSLPVALSLVCVMTFSACGQQAATTNKNVPQQDAMNTVSDSQNSLNPDNQIVANQNATSTDQGQMENTLEQKKVEENPAFSESSDTLCTLEYMPVCGKRPIQCITTPCDPIEQTFSNRCVAESEGAIDIVDGACAMSADDF